MHCMASFFSYFASGGRKIAPTEKSAAFARSGCAARTSASLSIMHSRSRADGLLHRIRHWDRGERIGGEVHCIQTVRRPLSVSKRTCVSPGSISSITA